MAVGNGDRFFAHNWKWVLSALFGFIGLVAVGAAEARSLHDKIDLCVQDSILLHQINERLIRIESILEQRRDTGD